MITLDWWKELCLYRSNDVFNPWGDSDDSYDVDGLLAPSSRVHRLHKHLNCQPRYLLIGEAPGYQGCRWTGVPFTSEWQLMLGMIPRVSCTARISTRHIPWREPSATIVWRTLKAARIHEQTVMWNAFPWHPHKPDTSLSNRAPTRIELGAAPFLLEQLIDQYKSTTVIAVGKVAAGACYNVLPVGLKERLHRVTHPSYGNARIFERQIMEITR